MPECAGHHPHNQAEADIGWLCYGCYSRLRSTILALPAVANWLRAHLAGTNNPTERVSGTREDPIPLRTDILDLIGPDSRKPVARVHPEHTTAPTTLLWEDGIIIGYYTTWADAVHARWETILEHPNPDVNIHRWQVRVTERGGTDQRGEEAIRATLDYWARTISTAGPVPWPDDNDIPHLANYLAANLTWTVEQPWIADLNHEIRDLTNKAHRLQPWLPEIMRDPDPCTRCQARAVILYVADSVLRCEEKMGGCGQVTVSDYLRKATA